MESQEYEESIERENKKLKRDLEKNERFTSGLIPALLIPLVMFGLNYLNLSSRVQEGFVSPSKIEVICENSDNTSILPETYLKIGTQKYALRDVNGMPVLSKYEVKPSEVKFVGGSE